MEGGSANDYDYCAGDPVNCNDLTGKAILYRDANFAINCGYIACTLYLSPKFVHEASSQEGIDLNSIARFGSKVATPAACKGGLKGGTLGAICLALAAGAFSSFAGQLVKADNANQAGHTACVSYKFGVVQAGTLAFAASTSGAYGVLFWSIGQFYAFKYNDSSTCAGLFL